MRDGMHADEIAALLKDRIEALAVELVGCAPTTKGRKDWRFYPKGGLVVTVAGPKRGIWCNHGAGEIGGDALDLIAHLRQCSKGDALKWARRWLGKAEAVPMSPRKSASVVAPGQDTVPLARRLWAESVGATNTIVTTYLASRGVDVPGGGVIRFHPACPRGSERLPAMLAVMTHPITGEPAGIHRTFLLPNGSGKAPGQAKMMAGKAGVIRLTADEDVTLGLGISEGIETGLTVMQRYGWGPVWACGSAGAIRNFPVLSGIEALTIFPDLDDSGAGRTAGEVCARRWHEAGREVQIIEPPSGQDWNTTAMRMAA